MNKCSPLSVFRRFEDIIGVEGEVLDKDLGSLVADGRIKPFPVARRGSVVDRRDKTPGEICSGFTIIAEPSLELRRQTWWDTLVQSYGPNREHS